MICGWLISMNNKKALIGRLTRERYLHNEQLVEKTVFRVLKRRSQLRLDDVITDPCADIADIDFSKYEPGIYQIEMIDVSTDMDTGLVDDWSLTLIQDGSNE